jgi:hypothetical protein
MGDDEEATITFDIGTEDSCELAFHSHLSQEESSYSSAIVNLCGSSSVGSWWRSVAVLPRQSAQLGSDCLRAWHGACLLANTGLSRRGLNESFHVYSEPQKDRGQAGGDC